MGEPTSEIYTGCPSTLASSLKLPPSPVKLLIPVILHILPACSTSTPHAEPYDPPQLICCQSRDVTCHFGTRGFRTALPTIWNSLPANVRSCVTLSTFRRHIKVTPLSVQLPHCLATHLSASDSLRPWRYINLLTY